MKGLNIKSLFVNHLEKMGFGVIVLTVALIWASEYFGGAWARETRNPIVLKQEIEKKREEINRSIWPEEKRQEFALVDFSQRAATLLRPIDTARYELSTDLFVPLNRPKEKAREPDLLAVESVDAQPGHVILALIPLDEELEGEEGAGDMPLADATPIDEDDPFQRRDEALPVDEVMEEEPAEYKTKAFRGKRKLSLGVGAVKEGGAAVGGQNDAQRALKGLGIGDGADDSRMTSGQRPQGRFYVAVRGVWPLRTQLERIQKALHLATPTAAYDHFSILDFVLERQTAQAGADPWSGKWETLDIEYSNQILDEVDGFDDDPVAMEVFDTSITSPLPMRMFGVWGSHATHPRIKKYDLSPQEQEREKALQARLMEEYKKMELETEKQRGPVKKGFNRQSNDFREMGTRMMRDDARGANDMFQNMAREMRNTPVGGRPLTAADLTAQITAAGRLVLFRYFDFDVKPGYAYRYRVKLRLMNPNYGRPPEEVDDPAYAEGEDRLTPDSNVSNVAVMPASPTYFLKDVERNPLAEEGRRNREVASVNIYEWHKKMGTQVFATVPLASLGQFLGGTQNTDVLDVATPVIEKDDYAFTTDDVLLDVTTAAALVPEEHPDLILPPKGKGAKTVSVGLAPEALVIGGGGDLKVLAAAGETAQEKALKLYAEKERKPFANMVRRPDEGVNPLDDFMDQDPKAKGKRGANNAIVRPGMKADNDPNPRRKGAGAGRGAGAGAGMGAGAGAGAAGIGAGAFPPGGRPGMGAGARAGAGAGAMPKGAAGAGAGTGKGRPKR